MWGTFAAANRRCSVSRIATSDEGRVLSLWHSVCLWVPMHSHSFRRAHDASAAGPQRASAAPRRGRRIQRQARVLRFDEIAERVAADAVSDEAGRTGGGQSAQPKRSPGPVLASCKNVTDRGRATRSPRRRSGAGALPWQGQTARATRGRDLQLNVPFPRKPPDLLMAESPPTGGLSAFKGARNRRHETGAEGRQIRAGRR